MIGLFTLKVVGIGTEIQCLFLFLIEIFNVSAFFANCFGMAFALFDFIIDFYNDYYDNGYNSKYNRKEKFL